MMTKFIWGALIAGLFATLAYAQPFPPQYTQQSTLFLTTTTWIVPNGVTVIYVDGCGPGGAGGGGQSSASTAGGGGGGAGQCIAGVPFNVVPGTSIAVTVPAAPTGGLAGAAGGAAVNTTIATLHGGTVTLYGGNPGSFGTAGTGGASGGGGGNGVTGAGCGAASSAGGIAGVNGSAVNSSWGFVWCGASGGGGGATAGASAAGGRPVAGGSNVFGTNGALAGSGNGSGGGGGTGIFGTGQAGAVVNVACSQAPTWAGYGGGGCGGGSNSQGGPGGPSFVLFRY